ncbi:MAG: hypothetical protein IPI23_08450 [Bacteroidetes bacterium]|nr:hypothetical protein [Bacteroidota bacterium]
MFYALLTFGQTTAPCYTDANKVFLKNELKSLTNIYKDALYDCNSNEPSTTGIDCENDLLNLKNNIEQLAALNSLVESLGCSFSIYRDEKPCATGKYCHSYKIEDKSEPSKSTSKTSDDVKNEYNLELAKIKSHERQEFFEMVYKIIGLFLEHAENAGLLEDIKNLIIGEESASKTYNISDKSRTAIDDNNDGLNEGYKTINPDGSTTFALDTDNDGRADELITYDKSGKVNAEKTVAKSTSTPTKKNSKPKPKEKPKPPPLGKLRINWVGVIDNAEGDDWPHGSAGNFHVLIYSPDKGCPGNQPEYSGYFNSDMELKGPSSGDQWFDLEDIVGTEKIWKVPIGSGDYKNEFLDGDQKIFIGDDGKGKIVYPWKYENQSVLLVIYESDPRIAGIPTRSHDMVFCALISRKATLKKYLTIADTKRPANDDAISNCKKRKIKWYTNVWKKGLTKGIPKVFLKVSTQ